MKNFKEKIKNKKTMVVIGVLVLCIAGGGVFAVTRNTANASDTETVEQDVTEIMKQDLTKSISVTGTISANETYNISSEVVNVLVKEVNVKVGDSVKAGDVLAKLDSSALSDSLKNAQNSASIAQQQADLSVSEAERNYNTTIFTNDTAVARALETLNATNANPDATDQEKKAAQQAYDDAVVARNKAVADSTDAVTNSKLSSQSSTQSANEAVTKAKEEVAKTVIKAPADGVVTAINFKENNTYTGGTFIVISDTSEFKVSATLDQYDISDVTTDLNATVTTDTTGTQEMKGKVTFVSPTPAETSATASTAATTTTASAGYPIEISLEDASERLRIGMNAKVTIEIASAKNVLSIPSNAIQQDDDGSYYVEVAEKTGEEGAETNTTKKVTVTQGLSNGYYVEITGDGLKEGMSVVLPVEETVTDDGGQEIYLF